MSKRGKILAIAASAVALLAVVQALTYALFAGHAERRIPWRGIRSLRDLGSLKAFDFVVVEPETWSGLTEAQRAVVSEELGRFVGTVYRSTEDVPKDAIVSVPVTEHDRQDYERWKGLNGISPTVLESRRREIEAGRRIVGFKGGIRLGWKLEGRGLFWIGCTSQDWMSNTGAQGRTDAYVWLLFGWVRVWNVRNWAA